MSNYYQDLADFILNKGACGFCHKLFDKATLVVAEWEGVKYRLCPECAKLSQPKEPVPDTMPRVPKKLLRVLGKDLGYTIGDLVSEAWDPYDAATREALVDVYTQLQAGCHPTIEVT